MAPLEMTKPNRVGRQLNDLDVLKYDTQGNGFSCCIIMPPCSQFVT